MASSRDIRLSFGASSPNDIVLSGVLRPVNVLLYVAETNNKDIRLRPLFDYTAEVTSYGNNGGLGDRRREIVVTSDIATSVPDGGTDWLVMINGNITANNTNARQPNTSNDNGDRNITFDWGVNAKIVIDEFRYYMSATDTFGIWTLEGSNNGTGWTQVCAAFTFGGIAGINKVSFLNSTPYRYYRLHTTSFQGGGGAGSWLEEVEFKLLDITPQASRPSYYNTFGFGNRGLSSASPITVTTDATLAGGAVQNAVDGDNNADTNAKGFTFNNAQVGVNVRFDFGVAVAVDTIHWYQSGSQTHGTWKLQGSPDASIWTDVGSPFTLGGNVGVTTYQMGGNLTTYRYYQIIGSPGSTSGLPVVNEVEFRVFTQASAPQGAGSAAGVGTATATGVAIWAVDGAAAGLATVTAVGVAVIPSTGSAAGLATVTAVGAAVIPGDGASSGTSTATAVGAAVMPSTGSSDGTSTATAVSVAIVQGAGLAAATDIWLRRGALIPSDIRLYGSNPGAAGLGTASAVGVAVMPSTGSCAGTSTVTATGVAVIPGDGLAAGTSSVTSVGRAVVPGVGNAAGTSTAIAVGADGANSGSATGAAAGTSTVAGVGVAVWTVPAAAAGTSTATAVGVIIIPAAGLAQGTSTVGAEGVNGTPPPPSEPNSISIVQLLDRSVTVLLGTGGFTLIVPAFMVNLSLPLTSQNAIVPDRGLSVNLSDRAIIVTIL